MSKSYTTDHLKEVFAFPFRDDRWINKFLIAIGLSLISFLLLPFFFLLGYTYEVMRRIIVDREAPSLPEWDDWGTFFTNGFKLFVLSMIYSLPGMILMYVPMFLFMFGIEILETTSPDSLLPLIGMPVIFLGWGFGMAFIFVSMLIAVVASSHMVAHDEFGAAFRFREMWPIFKKNVAGYLIGFVILMGIHMLVMMVSQVLIYSIILCCLYPVVLLVYQVYLMLIGSAFFSQAYVEGVERLEEEESKQPAGDESRDEEEPQEGEDGS